MSVDPRVVQQALIAVLIVVACYTDVTTMKIKNWLTLPIMALGSALAFWTLGAWWLGVAGLLTALVVAFLPWHTRVLSAGDVKMLMAAGALLGPHLAISATLWSLCIAVPAGLAALLYKRRLGNLKRVLVDGKTEEATMLWHAPVLGAGIVVAMVWPNAI